MSLANQTRKAERGRPEWRKLELSSAWPDATRRPAGWLAGLSYGAALLCWATATALQKSPTSDLHSRGTARARCLEADSKQLNGHHERDTRLARLWSCLACSGWAPIEPFVCLCLFDVSRGSVLKLERESEK